MMRIVVIGGTGTIGASVANLLARRHSVMPVSRHSSPAVDMAKSATIEAMLVEFRPVDAVICCAASVSMATFTSYTDESFQVSLQRKLFGQVKLTRLAVAAVSDKGSIILTSGRFGTPAPGMAAGALANAGLNAFVRAAATEMPRGIRLNAVSPGWVTETTNALGLTAVESTPASVVAKAYRDILEGRMNGEIIEPRV